MKKSMVTVGTSNYIGDYLLPKLLADWEKTNPNIELKLDISDTEKVFDDVIHGNLELGLIGACLETDDVLTEEFILNDSFCLIAPVSHPLAKQATVSASDLKGQDFILREPGSATRMWLRENLNKQQLSLDDLNVVAELDSHRAVISAVEAGAGLALVPKQTAVDPAKLGKVKMLTVKEWEPMQGNLYLISPRYNSLSTSANEFISFLQSEKNAVQKWVA